jgi:hypothetical protein
LSENRFGNGPALLSVLQMAGQLDATEDRPSDCALGECFHLAQTLGSEHDAREACNQDNLISYMGRWHASRNDGQSSHHITDLDPVEPYWERGEQVS